VYRAPVRYPRRIIGIIIFTSFIISMDTYTGLSALILLESQLSTL
jgi:hypothetical protein